MSNIALTAVTPKRSAHRSTSPKYPRERRRPKNARLRELVDDFQTSIENQRRKLDIQLYRIAELQAEMDDLKRVVRARQ